MKKTDKKIKGNFIHRLKFKLYLQKKEQKETSPLVHNHK